MTITERAIAHCFVAWAAALSIAEGAATDALRSVYIRKAEHIAAHAGYIAVRRGPR